MRERPNHLRGAKNQSGGLQDEGQMIRPIRFFFMFCSVDGHLEIIHHDTGLYWSFKTKSGHRKESVKLKGGSKKKKQKPVLTSKPSTALCFLQFHINKCRFTALSLLMLQL